ncbi:hypothetical protein BJ138DRAFT_1016351 [Hygrophoropsis aurantiaca]|uniref:Uncharacterized protein n=1 Tax=Hygrophoropsis aurantiaca TaxID=72124 RepID=A0ACB8A0C6_9AGAM|nr:hypothetical protein BJ138DRAFT_1016351 [Hygrophoropsis aurantiaca]
MSLPPTRYFQVTGFRAHTNGMQQWDDKPLISALIADRSQEMRPAGPESYLELVLGILPCGASYVLMTEKQMVAFSARHRERVPNKHPVEASYFTSLSPIRFFSLDDLSKKLATYKRKANSKQSDLDDSPANRGYVKMKNIVEHHRDDFEHQRLLSNLVRKTIDPHKFNTATYDWTSSIRVVSFTSTTWARDGRPRHERLKEPKLLDVGWTEVMLPGYFETNDNPPETVHMAFKTVIKNGQPAVHLQEFKYGETKQDASHAEVAAKVRSLFEHNSQKSGVPLLLLVHNEEIARSVLSYLGVDVSSYVSGIRHLLYAREVSNPLVSCGI